MAGKSNYLASAQVNHSMGKTAFAMPATIYAALCTVVPTAASTGATITEAAYTGYARVAVPAASLNASVNGAPLTNSAAIAWGQATAGTAAVVAIAFLDAATGGNLLRWATASLSVSAGVTPTIPIGTLPITES